MEPGRYNNQIGRMLEEKLFKRITSINLFDEIYTETDLIKLLGYKAASIDFMLIRNQNIIFIQCKYRLSRRRENHGVDNFLKSVEYVLDVFGKDRYSFGIWSSRRAPFEDNRSRLFERKIYSVDSFEDMESLVQKTVQFIMSKL